jgi:hypothetical protein
MRNATWLESLEARFGLSYNSSSLGTQVLGRHDGGSIAALVSAVESGFPMYSPTTSPYVLLPIGTIPRTNPQSLLLVGLSLQFFFLVSFSLLDFGCFGFLLKSGEQAF